MTETPTLTGPRVVLRALRVGDAADLFPLASDPRVTRHLAWESHQSPEETEAFIHRALAEQADDSRPCYHFCIALREGDRPVGVTSLGAIDQRHRHATVGSWIGRPHWSHGLVRESKALLLRFAFEDLGLERVQAWVDIDNHRSISSLEGCGMRREGMALRHAFHSGRFVHQLLFGILRGEHTDLVRQMLSTEA